MMVVPRRVTWLVAGSLLAGAGGLGSLAWFGADQMIRRRVPDVRSSPADFGLDYEEVSFTSTDGIPLAGYFIPAARVRGTVIFCHGHIGSLDPDLIYAPWFNQAGYNCLFFDFRAHGRSGGDRVSMGFYERRDLLGAVDYLRGRGIERVGVMGFSMGGVVAMTAAPQSSAMQAVVSDGGFTEICTAIAGGIQERMRTRWLHIPLSQLVVRAAGLRLGCDLRAADPIRWVSRISPRALLLIHGGQDPYVPTPQVQRLYNLAGEPKELWIVPEAGHRAVDRRCPDEYRTRVLAFFDKYLV